MKKLAFFVLLMAAYQLVYGKNDPITNDDERYVNPLKKRDNKQQATKHTDEYVTPDGKHETPVHNVYDEIIVSGMVRDKNGDPVVGAKVFVKGTGIGVVTDINGDYSIDAPADATLVFSFVDMTTSEVRVNGRNTINVRMEAVNSRTIGRVSYEKNPWIAGGLSLLLPGLGQYYNGQYIKGAVMTGLWIGSFILIGTELSDEMIEIGGLLLLGDYVWSIVDAAVVANKINRGELLTWSVGKGGVLSLRPDVRYTSIYPQSSMIPVSGLSLKFRW